MSLGSNQNESGMFKLNCLLKEVEVRKDVYFSREVTFARKVAKAFHETDYVTFFKLMDTGLSFFFFFFFFTLSLPHHHHPHPPPPPPLPSPSPHSNPSTLQRNPHLSPQPYT